MDLLYLILQGYAQNETVLVSNKTAMITSSPLLLKFNHITLATYILEKLTEEAAERSEVATKTIGPR